MVSGTSAPSSRTALDATDPSGIPAFGVDRRVHLWLLTKGASDAGDAAWTIALAWTAVRLADPAVAGLVVAAGTLPRAVVLLAGGVLADRLATLPLLRAVTAARIGVLLATVAMAMADAVSVPVLFAVAAAFGVCDAIFEPAVVTLGRQVVRPDDLPSYAGLSQTAGRLGTLGGAALGGVVVAVGGLGAAAGINAAVYVALWAVLLLVVRVRLPIGKVAGGPLLRGIRADLGAALAHLRAEPVTRRLVLTLSGLNLAVAPALGLGVALRVHDDGWGSTSLGLLQAVVGAGAVVGALVPLRRPPRDPRATGFALLPVQGLAIVLLAVPSAATTALACVVIGLTAGSASTLLSAVFQRTVDAAYLGRLAALQRLGDDVAMPAAMAVFGAMAGGLGVGVAFAAFGAVNTMATGAIALAARESVDVASAA